MPLPVDRVRRFAALAGILFVVLAIVSLVLPGEPPKADEAEKVGSFLTDKRGDILASDYVLGLAMLSFLVFAGTLRSLLGASDRDGLRPGATMLAGAAAATALTLASAAVLNGAAFEAASAGDQNLNLALYDVSNDLFSISGFAYAAFFFGAAIAIRASGGPLRALGGAAVAVGVLSVISPVTLFADSGFFAIGGAFGLLVAAASLIWVLAASVMLLRDKTGAEAASAGSARE